jgi:Uma2 family endonuclease
MRLLAERPGVRLTYDQGELEIKSPAMEHDDGSRFLGDLVFILTEELGLPLKRGGSVTLRRQLLQRGIEADDCYWIANAHRMAGRLRLNLRRDPPPDLAVEIDVTASSLDRLGIYAALGVPEVWRLEGNELYFLVLQKNGAYEEAPTSRSFSFLSPGDLLPFIRKARKVGDENAVLRQFRLWVRSRRKTADHNE